MVSYGTGTFPDKTGKIFSRSGVFPQGLEEISNNNNERTKTMNIINTGFGAYSFEGLYAKAMTILAALASEPAASTYPGYDTLKTAVADAAAALQVEISRGNAGAADAPAVARTALIDALKALADALESETPGNRATLGTTGYDLRKIPEHDASPTGAPQDVLAKPTGNPGEAKLSCEAVPQAVSYGVRTTQDMASGTYTSGPSATKIRNLLFTGLERGKD